ncbi:hypothetical protein WJX84_004936 [Apatococcus fuscideae]|uniref:Protein kinase domain-containing protein n=1 Tax=Apatococcus fuscideae TaxID=2026836 RepID=A0AAW1SPZ6_9CHLO
MAFAPYRPQRTLEQLPGGGSACASFNPVLILTLGSGQLETRLGGKGDKGRERGATQTLPDGRLYLGVHLPLLAQRFQFLRLLGSGSAGQVILALDTFRGPQAYVAIKVLQRQCLAAGLKEMQVLRYFTSQAPRWAPIVDIRGAFMHAGHLCLVLERLGPSLLDYTVSSAGLPLPQQLLQLRKIAHQLLVALRSLHERHIVHADMKPENCLLEVDAAGRPGSVRVKLVDLGSCFSVTAMDTLHATIDAQTLPYRAPEVVMRSGCGAPMDLWSLGAILAELILHRPLFPAHTPKQLLQQVAASLGPRNVVPAVPLGSARLPAVSIAQPQLGVFRTAALRLKTSGRRLQPTQQLLLSWQQAACPLQLELARLDQDLARLVMGLLDQNPSTRLTAEEALRHPFLAPLGTGRCLGTARQAQPHPATPT